MTEVGEGGEQDQDGGDAVEDEGRVFKLVKCT